MKLLCIEKVIKEQNDGGKLICSANNICVSDFGNKKNKFVNGFSFGQIKSIFLT